MAAEGQGRGRQQPETISEVPLDKPRLSRYMHSEVCAFGKGSRLSSDDVTNSTHEAGLYGRGQSVSRSVSRGILYLPRCVCLGHVVSVSSRPAMVPCLQRDKSSDTHD